MGWVWSRYVERLLGIQFVQADEYWRCSEIFKLKIRDHLKAFGIDFVK